MKLYREINVIFTVQLHSDRVQNEIIQVPDEPSALYHLKSPGDVYDELYKDNTYGYNISGPTPPPEVEAEAEPEIPPLDLSKEELLALYQAAVAKATKLKFHEGESRPAGPPVIALDDDVSQGGYFFLLTSNHSLINAMYSSKNSFLLSS